MKIFLFPVLGRSVSNGFTVSFQTCLCPAWSRAAGGLQVSPSSGVPGGPASGPQHPHEEGGLQPWGGAGNRPGLGRFLRSLRFAGRCVRRMEKGVLVWSLLNTIRCVDSTEQAGPSDRTVP